jgi:restriction system protein
MDIWKYDDIASIVSASAIYSSTCIFCKANITILPATYEEEENGDECGTQVGVCQVCGWWKVLKDYASGIRFENDVVDGYERILQRRGAIGSLKELDLTDISQPIEVVRKYLAAKYDDRFILHPRLLEETVGSVFGDIGFIARVTAYTGDNGIDVILDGPNGNAIGVQVKRYKNAISVEQIRSFAGALMLGGYSKGIFVTTSDFQSGANKTANLAAIRGIPIALVNAKQFYDALGLAQRKKYNIENDLDVPFKNISKSYLNLIL